jgi:hypothetical protein
MPKLKTSALETRIARYNACGEATAKPQRRAFRGPFGRTDEGLEGAEKIARDQLKG